MSWAAKRSYTARNRLAQGGTNLASFFCSPATIQDGSGNIIPSPYTGGGVANAKVEGALQVPTPVGSAGASLVLGPDGFFDGGLFDPDQLDSYIASQRRE